jgi:hypothetical protein
LGHPIKIQKTVLPAILYGPLKPYKDNWDVFAHDYHRLTTDGLTAALREIKRLQLSLTLARLKARIPI